MNNTGTKKGTIMT